MDGARDVHAHVVLLPGPACGDRFLIAQQRVDVLPVVDDLVPHHPVLVGRVDPEKLDARAVDDGHPVGRGKPPLGILRVGHQAAHVVLDSDGREVVDGAGPRVIAVDNRGGRLQRAGCRAVVQRPFQRLVHQRLGQFVRPVPGARVVVDGQGFGHRDGNGWLDGRNRFEVAPVR